MLTAEELDARTAEFATGVYDEHEHYETTSDAIASLTRSPHTSGRRNIVWRADGEPINVFRRPGQLFVCATGCCCGHTERGHAPVPVELYHQEWARRRIRHKVHLSLGGCLGPCALSNVVLLLYAGHEIWFHSVTGDEQVIAIFDYIEAMVRADRYLPPPPALAAQVFDVFDQPVPCPAEPAPHELFATGIVPVSIRLDSSASPGRAPATRRTATLITPGGSMPTHPILMSAVQYDAALKAGSLAVTDLAAIAADLGVDGVEFREVYWRDKARELPAAREQIEQHGLRLTYCTFTPLFSADPAVRAQLLTDIDDAAALGSPLLRVFLGVSDMPASPTTGRRPGPARGRRSMRAGEHGLRLALENHINVLGPRLAQIKGALETLASPVMGTNIDTSNYIQNGEPLLEAIAALTTLDHLLASEGRPHGRRRDRGRAARPGHSGFRRDPGRVCRGGDDFPLCFEFGGGTDPAATISTSRDYIRGLMRAG